MDAVGKYMFLHMNIHGYETVDSGTGGIRGIAAARLSLKPGQHVEYIVNLNLNGMAWTIRKRFSDFAKLHATLKNRLPSVPDLPAKSFVRQFHHEFLENRKISLNSYLQKLSRRDLLRCMEIQSFFGLTERLDLLARDIDLIDREYSMKERERKLSARDALVRERETRLAELEAHLSDREHVLRKLVDDARESQRQEDVQLAKRQEELDAFDASLCARKQKLAEREESLRAERKRIQDEENHLIRRKACLIQLDFGLAKLEEQADNTREQRVAARESRQTDIGTREQADNTREQRVAAREANSAVGLKTEVRRVLPLSRAAQNLFCDAHGIALGAIGIVYPLATKDFQIGVASEKQPFVESVGIIFQSNSSACPAAMAAALRDVRNRLL